MNIFLKILRTIGIVIGAIIILVALFFGWLTIVEYRPKAEEPVKVSKNLNNTQTPKAKLNEEFSVISWNVGYGCLGNNADFFMDGGKQVNTATKQRTLENITDIADTLKSENPSLILMQECDVNSARSHHVNECLFFQKAFDTFESTFATNYKVPFIPYPLPPIGKVHSGLVTLSEYQINSSTRVALPCPFKWPVRLGNLKRALLVNRIPIENSNKELVVIDLHLEAYDSGEGKIAQTKLFRKVLEEEVNKGNYVIAGGDFNQVFSNVDTSAYPLISENYWQPGIIEVSDFPEDVTLITSTNAPTCRSLDRPLTGTDNSPDKFQYYVIDGFIVSNNVKIQNIKTIDKGFVPSDHNPLKLDVILE